MKERQRGIVVKVDGKHVKTVPKKYEGVVEDTSFIIADNRKRLTTFERFELDSRLWIDSLPWDKRYIQSMIMGEGISEVYHVNDRNGDTTFQAKYKNGVVVYIPHSLYRKAPNSIMLSKNQL